MSNQWYFEWDHHKFGPYTGAQLKELGALGRLQPTDTVWKAGIEKGQLAAKVKHLFPLLPTQHCSGESNGHAVEDLAAPLEPSSDLSQVVPGQDAGVEGLSPSGDEQETPPEECSERIPEGLKFKRRAGESETSALPTPWTRSPDLEKGEHSTPETFPALPTVADRKLEPPAPPLANQPPPWQQPVRKKRAIAVKGAVLLSQDGEYVQYRKKCGKCGHEDSCARGIPIRSGVTRDHFFCPKCKKSGEVEIQGIG